MTLLDSLMGVLDAETLGILGDPIIYTPAAPLSTPLPINAFVEHGDVIGSSLGGASVRADVLIAVRKVDVALPAKGDAITIPARGETRRVTNHRNDASGRWWIIESGKA